MRILLFDGAVTGHHPSYACRLAMEMAARGHHVLLAVPDEAYLRGGGQVSEPDVRHVPIPTFGRAGSVAWRLLQAAREWRTFCALARVSRVDVAHHLYLDGAEPAWAVMPRCDGAALFATLFWSPLPETGLGPLTRIYRHTRQMALRHLVTSGRLDGVFVHSRTAHLRVSARRRSSNHFSLVHDPSPPPALIEQSAARAQLGLPLDLPLLLFFGGLREDKGPDLLIRAVQQTESECLVVFAGVDERSALQRLAGRLRSGPPWPRVLIREGFVPEPDVPLYFRAADVVMLPYRRSFGGTSGVLQQAAAAARPVIAADVGDVGPTVREWGLGLVVRPEDPAALAAAIDQFLASRDRLSSELGEAAARFARETSWGRLAEDLLDVYERTLARRS